MGVGEDRLVGYACSGELLKVERKINRLLAEGRGKQAVSKGEGETGY